MDTRQLLSIISFLLQKKEDDENDDFLAILSIIRNLLQIIGPALSRTFINDGQPIKNKLLLGIWALSTRESFCEVANRFGFRTRSKT
uniref:Uncharacterized protein n=1 Tax=Daphnia galeata TaxID=27404 RepID=A0A8J2WJW0_9CRUS|nr:unnamed protein product [Daphnia galeata]